MGRKAELAVVAGPASEADAVEAPYGDGFVKRASELIEELVRSRAILAAAEAKQAELTVEVREARASVKELSAQLLLDVVKGQRKAKKMVRSSGVASQPAWPINGGTKRLILRALDNNGVMKSAEIAEEIGKSATTISPALTQLKARGMIEKLSDGSWGLTEAQQKLMREAEQ